MEQSSNAVLIEPVPAAGQCVNTAPSQQMPPSQETIRKHYLSHEAAVKSIGTFYYLGAALLIISSVIHMARPDMNEPLLGQIAACTVMFSLGVFLALVGYSLKILRPWSRIAAFVLAIIGLLAFPLGTVINGYILYLVASKKGEDVFSQDYKAVLIATPHIRYKTPILGWIIFGLGAVLIGFAIVATLTSR